MFTKILRLCMFIAPLSALFIPATGHAGFPLPDLSEVPAKKSMAIDGIWRVTSVNSRVRISKGRAYALDSWKVWFSTVEPNKVIQKDFRYLGDGNFSGEDLIMSDKFTCKIQPNGNLGCKVGWIPFTFAPVELNKPLEYIGMMTQAGLEPDQSPYLKNWILAEKKKRAVQNEIEQAGATDTQLPDTDGTSDTGNELVLTDPEPEAGADGSPVDPVQGGADEELVLTDPEPAVDDELVLTDPEPVADGELEPLEEEALEEGALEEGTEEEGGKPKLKLPKVEKFKATTHARVKHKPRVCAGKEVYLSGTSCYSCPAGFKRASLGREMTHLEACQERGLPKHRYTRATYTGKPKSFNRCPGKQVYFSDGGCYSCPAGFKRNGLKKMTHPEACQERGLPKHRYTRATFAYKLDLNPLPCPKGQFAHDGYCKSCPAGSIRVQAWWVDTGYCLRKQ